MMLVNPTMEMVNIPRTGMLDEMLYGKDKNINAVGVAYTKGIRV